MLKTRREINFQREKSSKREFLRPLHDFSGKTIYLKFLTNERQQQQRQQARRFLLVVNNKKNRQPRNIFLSLIHSLFFKRSFVAKKQPLLVYYQECFWMRMIFKNDEKINSHENKEDGEERTFANRECFIWFDWL